MPAPSSPTSPRDPRYYVPRRPSPLSLPPLAPHMAFQGPSTHHVTFQAPSHGFQAFATLAVPNTAHEQGGRVYKEPRYPLEAQRRFLSEARKALNEVKRDKDEEQVCGLRCRCIECIRLILHSRNHPAKHCPRLHRRQRNDSPKRSRLRR